MPIYEYECAKCKKRFDYLQKMNETPKKKCEACGGKLERLISPAGFHLKGTGWYKTDYASKPSGGNKKEEGGEGKEAKAADKKESKESKKD